MKAISIRQPYAELIASGRKSIEVRTWQDSYCGPLLIVASSQPNREALANFNMRNLPCGVAVCVVELARVERSGRDFYCYGAQCGVWRDDYLWHLVAPRRVKPSPIKGRLRLYVVDDSLISAA